MPLAEVTLEVDSMPIPSPVKELLDEADRRMEEFVYRRRDTPIVGFVPSDWVAVYRALQRVTESQLTQGNSFCEWGSGLGVVADLGAMLGLNACGIEVEASLVEAARGLAEDFDLSVEFAEGSFIPTGTEVPIECLDEISWLDVDSHDGYDQLGLGPDDFDLVFAFPWPSEVPAVIDLFDQFAAEGALLLLNRGEDEGLQLLRKKLRRR
jgi:hypothetical protein